MAMDLKLTEDIRRWLDTPPAERDVKAGAELLLRLNRNRFLYHRALARPQAMLPKLEYELKKHLRLRLDGLTVADVAAMEREVMPRVAALVGDAPVGNAPAGDAPGAAEEGGAPARTADSGSPGTVPEGGVSGVLAGDIPAHGRRADHDRLPADIRAIYERGGVLFAKVKQLYAHLLTMDGSTACDRYEYLKQLAEAEAEYRRGWERYDGYDASAPVSPREEEAGRVARAVSAARKFLSRNLGALSSLEPGSEAYTALHGEMQERILTVERCGGGFAKNFAARLSAAGFALSADMPVPDGGGDSDNNKV